MPTTVKEVKTLFTLDSKSLNEGMKDADKSVKALKKEFNGTQKDINNFIKELKGVKKELKDLDKDASIDLNTDEAIGEVDALIRKMESVKRATQSLKREADNCLDGMNGDNIDLATFGRLESLLKDMSRIEVVNSDSIDKAQSKVRDLVSSLDSIEADIDITSRIELASAFGNNDSMRHWVDNKSSGSFSGADDTQQALNRLISVASDIASNQSNLNIDKVSINNDEDLKRLSNDVSGVSKNINAVSDGFKQVNQQTLESVANSKAYEAQMQELASTMMQFGAIAKESFNFDFSDNLNSQELEQELNKVMGIIKQTSNSIQVDSKNVLSIANAYQQVTAELKQVEAMQLQVNKACDDYAKGLKTAQESLETIQKSGGPDEMLDELQAQEDVLRDIVNQNEKQLTVIRKTSRELDEQKALLNQKERQLKEEYNVLQKNTKETKEQTDELEEQEGVLGKLKKAFQGIADVAAPIGDIFNIDTSKLTSNLGNLSKAGASASKGLSGVGKSAGASGASLGALGVTAGVTAGALVVLVGAVASVVAGLKGLYKVFQETLPEFKEFESAIGRTTASLSGGVEDIEAYGNALKDAFMEQGYVDNIDDFTDAFIRVNQMLRGFENVDLTKLTEDILMVAETTKWDVNEITRAIKNMAVNMGMDVTSALDMVYSAWQQTGDPANDLLDTFNEYSSQFKKMGVSGEWAFEKIVKGLQSGVYNSDKIADSFKELWLRIADPADIDTSDLDALGYTMQDIANGSDNVVNAFDKLGISTNKFKEEMAKGGESAENAMDTLITKISEVSDKAEQQNIIAALFGAPGEDMGTEFFDFIAESEETLDNFNGSVEESAVILESTLGYQLEQLGNTWNVFKASLFDEAFAPAVQEFVSFFTDNLDVIKAKVMDEFIPAFMELAFAIVGPFVEGELSLESFVMGLITGLAEGIKAIAVFIDVCNRIIAVFRLITNAIEIVWNAFTAGCVVILKVFNQVVYGILAGLGFVVDGITSFGANFKAIMSNCGIALENVGIAIVNAFGSGFAEAQKLAAKGVNAIIDMVNMIPGVDVGHVSWGGGSYSKKGYKEFKSLDNKGTDLFGTAMGWMNESNATADKMLEKDAKDFSKDMNDFKNAWNTLTAESIGKQTDNALASYKKLREEQKKELKAKEDTVKAQQNYNNLLEEASKKDKVSGGNTTKKEVGDAKKELDKAEKDLDKAKKAEDKAKKNKDKAQKDKDKAEKDAAVAKAKALKDAEAAAAKMLKEQQEAIKKRIAWEKEYYNNKRSWQEDINKQQLALVDDNIEAMKLEMQMIQSIKDSYALTTDQMISYTQKQFDLSVKVRDEYTKRVQDALKKELEASKKKANSEYEEEHRKNNKLIKDKERQIKAIEALMRENEYSDSQEDLDYEIQKTEEEYQKYMFATSYEGIQKREELEERLRELRLEKERASKKKELEDKKQSLEDEIDDIKDKDDEQQAEAERQAQKLEELYDNMFDELETLFEGGTANIADIQQYAQETNNKTIKNLLNEYVANYKSAMDEVQKYMLSMNQIQGWYQNDLQQGADEGKLTGDKDAVDKNDVIGGIIERPKAAQQYNALKKEHSKLSAKKNKTNTDKARIKTIEAEVASLRKKYGFSGYQVDGSHADGLNRVPFNGYLAELHKNEAILTAGEADIWRQLKQVNLPNISNVMNRQMANMDSARTETIINNNNVTNNSGPLLHIENFNNNSNADVRKIAYEINNNIGVRNRSKGRI